MKLQTPRKRLSRRVNRYQLSAVRSTDGAANIRVFDRHGHLFLEWDGLKARHLIDSGAVPAEFCNVGFRPCHKNYLWHLILAAAATERILDQLGYIDSIGERCTALLSRNRMKMPHQLCIRLRRLNQPLVGPLKRIAQVLFAYPGRHCNADDVQNLLRLNTPSYEERNVSSKLDELACTGLVQRIEVDSNNVFYDTNITPHLHLFDESTRELRDATLHGVIRLDSDSISTEVHVQNGSDLVIRNAAR